MHYVICHGLGEGPSQWRPVLGRICVQADCPALFDMVSGSLTYEKLYAAFAEYCSAKSGELHLCGLSLGGVLSLSYASANPEKVASLVLIGTPYKIPPVSFALQNAVFRLLPQRAFREMGLTKKDAIALMGSMAKLDIPGMAGKITCRTMVLCGEKDSANRKSAAALHSRIPQSQLAFIQNAGHQVNLDAGEALSREINRFWGQRAE